MLFHEIYGFGYQAATKIINEIIEQPLNIKDLKEVIKKQSFELNDDLLSKMLKEDEEDRSLLYIDMVEKSISTKNGFWASKPKIIQEEKVYTTIKKLPEISLTILQRRWMKAMLNDPRIRLFLDEKEDVYQGLEDVEPLYGPEIFVYYDRYGDADPYTNDIYRDNFKKILKAIEKKQLLEICFETGKNRKYTFCMLPDHLEYSEKDDRFRLIAATDKKVMTINLARILSCKYSNKSIDCVPIIQKKNEVVFRLKDEKNALDRVLRHFSYLEKRTKKISDTEYEIKLKYDPADENEILIQILSFGPMIKVTEPIEIIEKIRNRIDSQFAITSIEKI